MSTDSQGAINSSVSLGDIPMMRAAELYLIEAEALAKDNKEAQSKIVFTEFEKNRNPAYVSSVKTGQAYIDEVLTSRRLELWGEGFRWFDLKRLNLACKRDGNNFSVTFCGFINKEQSQEDGWYYEIPKIETDNNSLMVKNY